MSTIPDRTLQTLQVLRQVKSLTQTHEKIQLFQVQSTVSSIMIQTKFDVNRIRADSIVLNTLTPFLVVPPLHAFNKKFSCPHLFGIFKTSLTPPVYLVKTGSR